MLGYGGVLSIVMECCHVVMLDHLVGNGGELSYSIRFCGGLLSCCVGRMVV